MKKEEEKCIGKADIVVTTNRKDVLLVGIISGLTEENAKLLMSTIHEVVFYDTKVSRDSNGITSISFTDNLGDNVQVDDVEAHIEFMKGAMHFIGDTVLNLTILEHIRKDYEGTKKKLLENKESSD